MNKVERFTVELGSAFKTSAIPAVYKEWVLQEEWTTYELVSVTPGQEVNLLDFVLDVPQNAAKLLKFTTDRKALGFFLDSNDALLEDNIAYLVRPKDNWVEVEIGEPVFNS